MRFASVSKVNSMDITAAAAVAAATAPLRLLVVIAIVASTVLTSVDAFTTPTSAAIGSSTFRRVPVGGRTTSSTSSTSTSSRVGRISPPLYSSNKDAAGNEARVQKLQTVLKDLDGIEESVEAATSMTDLQTQEAELDKLIRLSNELVVIDIPTLLAEGDASLSMEDFQKSMQLFLQLPPTLQSAMLEALRDVKKGDVDNNKNWQNQELSLLNLPLFIKELHNERFQLTEQRLQDSLKRVQNRSQGGFVITMSSGDKLQTLTLNDPKTGKKIDLGSVSTEKNAESFFREIFDTDRTPEEMQRDGNVKQFTTRAIRKEGIEPSEQDLETLMLALQATAPNTGIQKGIYGVSDTPLKVPGGYLIRGTPTNATWTTDEFMDKLEATLPKADSWNGTVTYMDDTADIKPEDLFEPNNVIMLWHKDFTPEANPNFARVSTVAAIITTLVFSVGTFGSNEAVFNKLNDLTAIGDYSGLDWFNGEILQVLVPLVAILASHELGHKLTAKRDQFTISAIPTLLPFLNALPLLGSYTKITSPPKNRASLFDFALAGPALGFAASFAFLLQGLAMTNDILNGGDLAAIKLLPALPSQVVQLSTFGTTLIDTLMNSGIATVANQANGVPVPLHPFAVAGYCGLLINAVALLPLGSTDGGRLSQAVFGRKGHAVIGAAMWFALLCANFTIGGTQGDLLISAWVVYNIVENDMEVPLRQEVDGVDAGRILLAFSAWFLTALVLIPVQLP